MAQQKLSRKEVKEILRKEKEKERQEKERLKQEKKDAKKSKKSSSNNKSSYDKSNETKSSNVRSESESKKPNSELIAKAEKLGIKNPQDFSQERLKQLILLQEIREANKAKTESQKVSNSDENVGNKNWSIVNPNSIGKIDVDRVRKITDGEIDLKQEKKQRELEELAKKQQQELVDKLERENKLKQKEQEILLKEQQQKQQQKEQELIDKLERENKLKQKEQEILLKEQQQKQKEQEKANNNNSLLVESLSGLNQKMTEKELHFQKEQYQKLLEENISLKLENQQLSNNEIIKRQDNFRKEFDNRIEKLKDKNDSLSKVDLENLFMKLQLQFEKERLDWEKEKVKSEKNIQSLNTNNNFINDESIKDLIRNEVKRQVSDNINFKNNTRREAAKQKSGYNNSNYGYRQDNLDNDDGILKTIEMEIKYLNQKIDNLEKQNTILHSNKINENLASENLVNEKLIKNIVDEIDHLQKILDEDKSDE